MDAHGFFFLFCCAATFLLAGAQRGFISIDCGLNDTATYINQLNNLTYVSDDGFIDSGMNGLIDPTSIGKGSNKVYFTVRFFPNYKRNCYQLPATVDTKYIVRATFLYGNYDGLDTPPSFDLHLGVNVWETVNLTDNNKPFWTELVVQAEARFLYVCLVNTGHGTPFISSLKLRPLPQNMYAPANSSLYLALKTFRRVDLGAKQPSWYPTDRLDRIWESNYDGYGTPYITSLPVTESANLMFGLPSVVMQTAVYSPDEIRVNWTGGVDDRFHLFLEFADVVPPTAGGSRTMKVQMNGEDWGDASIFYLHTNVLYSTTPLNNASEYSFSIRSANASDEGAVLNSFEIYKVVTFNGSATEEGDVMAVTAMKEYYQLKKNWIADPCLPFPWDGLTCDGSQTVGLDLSSSGLSGMISRHIFSLTKLKTLNLSTNNLHGSVPPFLLEMPYLVNIDLSSNNLSGPIPDLMRERVRSGKLTLRIEGNPHICLKDQCTQDQKSHAGKNVVSVISMVISLVLLVCLIFI
ncbi:putative leucine-rich repeat receptor-like serine/threonine-protein kinase At2g19230 [Nymphaea colorata]|nr:putative leucine-rich repeat receptor-like serine/threonine-protein kinase At2g19230 [Nymphaea colorata]